MIKKTLAEIIEQESRYEFEDKLYGTAACIDAIKSAVKRENKSLYQLLEEYVDRANSDIFFNKRMVLACWKLINEEE